MTGDTHYDWEILGELAEGLLDDDAARPIREHLAVCDPCGERLADLAAVREVLAATPRPAMPMGVALRIDQAIAAESDRRAADRRAVAVAEAPDWHRLMAGSPWETPAESSPSPAPEPALAPVRLGVVADDGTVVPTGRRAPSRRQRWIMPVSAAAAACAVVGSVALASNVLTVADGSPPPTATLAKAPEPPRENMSAMGYKVTATGFNYSDRVLRGSLSDYFAPAPVAGGAESVDVKLTRCVSEVAERVGKAPFQVDQGYYLGQEATIMLFWKQRAANRVQVRVLGPECKNLRKPALAKWK